MEEQGEVHRERISTTTAILMISAALAFDGLQLAVVGVPFVGWMLAPGVFIISWLVFYTWNSLLGISFSDTIVKMATKAQKYLLKYVPMVLEYIPFVGNLVPGITIMTAVNIAFIWSEDFVYNRTHGKIDIEKIMNKADRHAKRRDNVKTEGQKISFSDITQALKEENVIKETPEEKLASANEFVEAKITDFQKKPVIRDIISEKQPRPRIISSNETEDDLEEFGGLGKISPYNQYQNPRGEEEDLAA